MEKLIVYSLVGPSKEIKGPIVILLWHLTQHEVKRVVIPRLREGLGNLTAAGDKRILSAHDLGEHTPHVC